MAKESSIAPKERINITFKPAIGGAQEEIELPLKIMVMGNFLQRFDPRRIVERKPIQISKNNFDDVMEKQKLSLHLNVPNKMHQETEDQYLDVKLDIHSLKDFTPEGVARQVPELQKLLELREALVSLKGPLGNFPTFRNAIEDILKNEDQRQQVMDELGIDAATLQRKLPNGNRPTKKNEKTEKNTK